MTVSGDGRLLEADVGEFSAGTLSTCVALFLFFFFLALFDEEADGGEYCWSWIFALPLEANISSISDILGLAAFGYV